MYILKGFASNSQLTNNAVGAVAAIGEVSPRTMTFSREKGFYSSTKNPSLGFISFVSFEDTVIDSVFEELTPVFKDNVLTVIEYVYSKILTSNNEMSIDDFLYELTTYFANSITDISVGDIVSDGVNAAPAYVAWRCLTNGAGNNAIKVWFSDAAMAAQYDDYEIVVVPPTKNLNDFFQSGSEVVRMVSSWTTNDKLLQVNSVRGEYPETSLNVQTYTYTDPMNASRKIDVDWYINVYGNAGSNVDALNSAVERFIEKNSTKAQSEWRGIFPDIYHRTEFVIIPIWDQYAIPNKVTEMGIYSSLVNFGRVRGMVEPFLYGYDKDYITKELSIFPNQYKSLQLAIIGGSQNKNDWFDIRQIYPDYINVLSTSVDFNRMSQATREWAISIYEMLIVAETMTRFTTMPIGMYKLIRGNTLYVSKLIKGVNYLVVAKSNMTTAIGG